MAAPFYEPFPGGRAHCSHVPLPGTQPAHPHAGPIRDRSTLGSQAKGPGLGLQRWSGEDEGVR